MGGPWHLGGCELPYGVEDGLQVSRVTSVLASGLRELWVVSRGCRWPQEVSGVLGGLMVTSRDFWWLQGIAGDSSCCRWPRQVAVGDVGGLGGLQMIAGSLWEHHGVKCYLGGSWMALRGRGWPRRWP
jgi:hypothetical protein